MSRQVEAERRHLHELDLHDVEVVAGEHLVERVLEVSSAGRQRVLVAVRRQQRAQLTLPLRPRTRAVRSSGRCAPPGSRRGSPRATRRSHWSVALNDSTDTSWRVASSRTIPSMRRCPPNLGGLGRNGDTNKNFIGMSDRTRSGPANPERSAGAWGKHVAMSRIGGLWRKRRHVIAVAAVGVAGTTSSADAAKSADTTPPSTDGVGDPGGRCIVRLHGKSGAGGETVEEDGVMNVLPDGNAEGWGGRQWLYFPEEKYLRGPRHRRRRDRVQRVRRRHHQRLLQRRRRSPPSCTAAARRSMGASCGSSSTTRCRTKACSSAHLIQPSAVTLYWTGALRVDRAAGLELRRSGLDVRGRRDDRDRCLRRGARRRRCSRASSTSTRGTGTPRSWATGRDPSQRSRSPRRCRRRRDHVTFLTIT